MEDARKVLPDFLAAGVGVTDIFAAYEPHVRTLLQTYAPGLGGPHQQHQERRAADPADPRRRPALCVRRDPAGRAQSRPPPTADRRPVRRVVQHASARSRARSGAGALTAMTRSRLLVGGLVLALVASLVAVVLLWRDRDDDAAEDRAAASTELVDAALAAEQAARDTVVQMTSYSFRTVDDDFDWVDAAGTKKFQENFADAAKAAIAYVKTLKATAVGTVMDSAATAADADHVKVLLFVDQEIRSKGESGSRLDQPRVTMQMVRQDGEWLVDEVQVNNLVSTPGSG